MSFADAFAKGGHPTVKKDAPKASPTEKPDDGLGPLRQAAAMSHGKRKMEYDAALKKAASKNC